MAADRPPDGVVRVRAHNPEPLTLTGTNTYVVRAGPVAVVVDPGPALPDHIEAVLGAAERAGGIASIALTHGHSDHAEAAGELAAKAGGVPIAAAPGVAGATLELGDGERIGPLEALETPGHSADHLCFLADGVCFSGDLVLGEGSVFVPPDGGSLRAYLDSLERLRERKPEVLAPGHGPYVWDPQPKLAGYIEHRLERERMLVAALDRGLREPDDLLDAAWSDVPAELRPAAALTLQSHLEKLRQEGRLPPGM